MNVVVVRAYIDGEQVSYHVLSLDCAVRIPLLGIDISKDARYPTELMVTIDEVKK
jgi:hypothetical protein